MKTEKIIETIYQIINSGKKMDEVNEKITEIVDAVKKENYNKAIDDVINKMDGLNAYVFKKDELENMKNTYNA